MAILKAQTKYGPVVGIKGINENITIFKGVPYAKPPMGELRFMAPQELEKWEEERLCQEFMPDNFSLPKNTLRNVGSEKVRQAENMHDSSIRSGYLKEPHHYYVSEDCLYVNIWTPAESENERLPVMVWTGNSSAHASFIMGEKYAQKGVVLVTLTTRGGIFGALATKKMVEMDPYNTSGNRGNLDMVAAFRWVKDNISAFGGDPDCITAFGESGGGAFCKFLITSPLTRGLLKRVIIMSSGGVWDVNPLLTLDEQIRKSEEVVAKVGWAYEDLVSKSAEEIYTVLGAEMRAKDGSPKSLSHGFMRAPIDNYCISDYAGRVIHKGLADDVDIMLGSIIEEWHNFPFQIVDGIGDYHREFALGATLSLPERYLVLGKKPAYHYFFERNLPGDDRPMNHTDELPYVFGSLDLYDRDWEAFDYHLSDVCMNYWIQFAKTGNPNVEGQPYWPEFTKETPQSMHFVGNEIKAETLTADRRVQKVVRFLLDHPGSLENKHKFLD